MTPVSARIVVIIASTRTVRFADSIIPWIGEQLDARGDVGVDIIDVRDVDLPFYDLPVPPAMAKREYRSDIERALGRKLDAADGYIVLTNEFNHGYSGALKNLLDHFFAEFERKPIAFIGYGNVGGSRAIEQLRQVAAELNMVSVRESVHIFGYQFPAAQEGGRQAEDVFNQLGPKLTAMVDNLLWWANALTNARNADMRQS